MIFEIYFERVDFYWMVDFLIIIFPSMTTLEQKIEEKISQVEKKIQFIKVVYKRGENFSKEVMDLKKEVDELGELENYTKYELCNLAINENEAKEGITFVKTSAKLNF